LSNNSGDNSNNNSISKHKTNDKIWYAEHFSLGILE
jgi:hypothetical protein